MEKKSLILYQLKCTDKTQREIIRKKLKKGAILNDKTIADYLIMILNKME